MLSRSCGQQFGFLTLQHCLLSAEYVPLSAIPRALRKYSKSFRYLLFNETKVRTLASTSESCHHDVILLGNCPDECHGLVKSL